MALTQLNPPLPMLTPKGVGVAHFVIDNGIEHHLVWVVAMDEGGEIWSIENPHVRLTANQTWGRTVDAGYTK